MIEEFKGTSELARVAEALPVRARVCLVILAADFALKYLRHSPDFSLACDALAITRNWHEQEAADLDRLDDMLEGEELLITYAVLDAQTRSEKEGLAWRTLALAVSYAAYHAFRAAGRRLSGSLNEVDETLLDFVDKDLRALDPSSMPLMIRAATYLRQHPDALLGRLKAHLLMR